MTSKQRRDATPERHERMSAVDTAWLRMDGPGNAMMIVSVLATATPVPAARLRRLVADRLLAFRRFRCRPVADALGAAWHEQPDFDLDAHFVVTTLPEPGGKAELEQLAASLASERLDPSRPLWQIHFVARYGNGSAWVLRVHHCYADGMAMVRVLLSLTEPDAAGPAATATPGPRPARRRRASPSPDPSRSLRDWFDQWSRPAGEVLETALVEGARLLEGGMQRLLHPDDTAQLAAQAGGMVAEFARVLGLPDDPPTPLRGRLSGVKGIAWSTPLVLEEVKTVGKALGCTVNDVLMATMAGALGAHLRDAHAVDTDGLVVRASVPVNLRAAEELVALGNRFGLVFVDLPVGTRDPLQRVFRMHDTMAALKGSLQPPMTLTVLGLLGLVPASLQAPAIELFSRKGTLVASNVPGPRAPLYLCGQRVGEMYFWVPQSGSMGLGISILSYAGQVFFGVIADRTLVPEPGRLIDRIAPEFERLLLGATVGLLALAEHPRRRARTPRRTNPPARDPRPSD